MTQRIQLAFLGFAASVLLAACAPESVRNASVPPAVVVPTKPITETGEIQGALYRIDIEASSFLRVTQK